MSEFLPIVLSCVRRGLKMGRFHDQGVLLKCLSGCIVLEGNSESVETRGSNP